MLSKYVVDFMTITTICGKIRTFFYDDSMLWRTVYDELVPKIQNNIDFLCNPNN